MAWTAAKRKSVQGYTPGLATPWPDAAKPVGWRAAVVGLFAADSYPAPAASVAVPRTVTTQRGAFFGRRGLDPSFWFAHTGGLMYQL